MGYIEVERCDTRHPGAMNQDQGFFARSLWRPDLADVYRLPVDGRYLEITTGKRRAAGLISRGVREYHTADFERLHLNGCGKACFSPVPGCCLPIVLKKIPENRVKHSRSGNFFLLSHPDYLIQVNTCTSSIVPGR
jgi:hypothetical protein